MPGAPASPRPIWPRRWAASRCDIDYANFKSEVAQRMGYAREQIYHEVWEAITALQQPGPDGKK